MAVIKNGGFFLCACAALCIICMQTASVNAAQFSLTIDANRQLGPWNRFYEQLISTDHMITMLHSFYGRNMQNALLRGVTECGFKYFRGHGIFNQDINLVDTNANGTLKLTWATFDSIYDAAQALGLRPIVEFSFTPPIMQSKPSVYLWYNNVPANTSLPKDLNKWRDLCDSVVRHCEGRYGVEEVRKWFFEVYNEPNLGGFFSGTQQDYFRLYDYASEGVRLADSLCKVGGPATAGQDTTWMSAFLRHVKNQTNYATNAVGSKCDFISYHRYAENPITQPGDASGLSNPKSMSDYQKAVINVCNRCNFTGLIINDEWGPSAQTYVQRENESCASFIAKTIHMLQSNGPDYPPPYMYGFWCISDIYEEFNAWQTGRVTAFDIPGNFGILLRGDPTIYDSYDVPKPSFNAFKMLHKMGTIQISDTGGTMGSGVNSFATMSADSSAIQIMIYDHYNLFGPGSDDVTLTVNNIPFANARIEHFVVDSGRSNSYTAWQGMGSPATPDAGQWATIKAAAELTYDDSTKNVTLTNNSYTESFAQRRFSVSLILIRDPSKIAVQKPNSPPQRFAQKLHAEFKNSELLVSLPSAGQHELALFNIKGAMVYKTNAIGRKTTAVSLPYLHKGTYVLRCGSGASSLTAKVVFCK